MSGYVRLHRALLDEHPAFRNDAQALAFAWLIAKAAWSPVCVRYKGHKIELQRGQLAVSQRDLARHLDRDKAWVERLFRRLRDEAMVETHAEAGVMLITICNYDKYQASSPEGEAADEALGEADARQRRGTEQRREESKKGRKEDRDSSSPRPQERTRADHIDYFELVRTYNWSAQLCGLPQCRWPISDSLRNSVRVRVKDHGFETIRQALGSVHEQRFFTCVGGWRPSFPELMRAKTMNNLVGGQYGRATRQSRSLLDAAAEVAAAFGSPELEADQSLALGGSTVVALPSPKRAAD